MSRVVLDFRESPDLAVIEPYLDWTDLEQAAKVREALAEHVINRNAQDASRRKG
jgi:hypothetical protein